MARLAHLSDIHLPLGLTGRWPKLWRDVAGAVCEAKPDAIIFTGDILDSAWPLTQAKRRLAWFVNEIAPATLPKNIPLFFVPGNHDLNTIQGLGRRRIIAAGVFEKTTHTVSGWQDPIRDTIHIYTIDSNHATWLARGAVNEEDLQSAELPASCKNADHLHVFALHHSVFTEPTRPGEHRFTTDDASLGLDDPDRLLRKLSEFGYDVVLHGHRHLSTSDTYAEPVAERRSGALWLVGAPSATKRAWQGFNLIDAQTHGRFQVSAVMQAQGRWLHPQLIASRDYDEARTRRWSDQTRHPKCDILDVQIENYSGTTTEHQTAHRQCGDIKVTMTLRGPQNLADKLPLPLARVVGYDGTSWRSIHASFGSGSPLPVDEEDGTIHIATHDGQDIEIKGVLLNALPSQPGDWDRMRASQPGLRDPFLLEPTIPARFLRLRVNCDQLLHLDLLARRAGNPALAAGQPNLIRDEKRFCATHDAGERKCVQDAIIFRPIVGLGYALTLDGVDPISGAHTEDEVSPTPYRVMQWQRTIENLAAAPSTMRQAIKTALDTLKARLIEIARQVSTNATDDLTVDLMSIYSGLRVVMTDAHTAARVENDPKHDPVGVAFPWGQGVAGRALRLEKEYNWSRSGKRAHPSTLPADNWYYRHPKIAVHAHVYCRPVITTENEQPYAIAMLSFATHDTQSGLAGIISQLRNPSGTVSVRKVCDAAVERFTDALSEALTQYHHHQDDDGGEQ